MSTLTNKTVLVIGGSSGIGYGVAKAALLERASHVIIASSSQERVNNALVRLKAEVATASQELGLPAEGILSGEVVDAKDSASVVAFMERVGEVDHFIWSSGDGLRLGFPNVDLDKNKDLFDVRFWGALTAIQTAKIRQGGSITLTVGSVVVKPGQSWSLAAGLMGAVDSVTRGLAVDMAPIRVNAVCPGLVKTELWDPMPEDKRNDLYEAYAKKLLVRHVASPDEIAEAYIFLMKCPYITGQRIEVDGGVKFT